MSWHRDRNLLDPGMSHLEYICAAGTDAGDINGADGVSANAGGGGVAVTLDPGQIYELLHYSWCMPNRNP